MDPLQSKNLSPPEEIGISLQRYESAIAHRTGVLAAFIKKHGFGLRFDGNETCFDHNSDELCISLKQLQSLGIDLSNSFLVDFIVGHEAGHFIEKIEDPKGYLDLLKELQYTKNGKEIFRLYNALADIYVNSLLADLMPVYRGKNGEYFADFVKELYRTNTFKNRDFSDRPLCYQFSDYLLNIGMGVANDIKLSPRVREIIDQGVDIAEGEGSCTTISYLDFINTFLRPLKDGEWSGTVSQRRTIIERYILPKFLELMEEDLRNNENKEAQLNSDQRSDQPNILKNPTLEEAIKEAKEIVQRNKEKKASPEDKAKQLANKQLASIGEKNNIPPNTVNDYIQRKNKLDNLSKSLAKIWERIKIVNYSDQTKLQGHYRQGVTLDRRKAVTEFSQISENPDLAEVMLRRQHIQQETHLPRKLRVWLVVDCSGSMSDKIDDIKDLQVSLGQSLIIRNNRAQDNEEDLECNLGIVIFNDQAEISLEPSKGITNEKLMTTYSKLIPNGHTYNHMALHEVIKWINKNPADQDSITSCSSETLDLIFNITDGKTENEDLTVGAIGILEELGVRCYAIYIDDGDSTQFDRIWNSGGKIRGCHIQHSPQIGEKIESLLGEIIPE